MMKHPVFLLILIFSPLFVCCNKSSENLSAFEAMDTFMSVKTFGKNSSKAASLAKAEIFRIEKLISVTDSESEVYKINENKIKSQDFGFSDEVAFLIDFTTKAAENTKGAFNPFLYPVTKEWGFTRKKYHVPSENLIQKLLLLCDYKNAFHPEKGMQLDFGGIGKGYAGDMALKVLKENGIESAILDLGGNVQALGKKPDGSLWNIGLKNPWESASSPVLALKISDCAVITSGGYERFFTGDDGKKYIHIFDSATGFPVQNNLVSVTVITSSGLTGDMLSTALFVMGKEKALDFWKNNKNYAFEMIILSDDFSILYTDGLKDRINLLYDFSKIEVAERR